MIDYSTINKVEAYVRDLFNSRLADEVLYHTIKHTLEVVKVVQEIGEAEGITDEEMELLIIAGWFHDTGHFHCCSGHEEHSTQYAKNYLSNESIPASRIDEIVECILATKIPQNPQNKLQEIICDADLCHLGEENIKERGDLLRKELELRGIKKLTDIEWMTHSLTFFNQHHFFTDYAKKKFGAQKEKNMHIMKLYLDYLIETKQ
jgi:predicted metal-dependent HD superfamily phosphohydrolase